MPEERRGGQRPARSPLAPQVGRLDVELDAQFNLIERLLISRGSTCTLKRPENKQIHDPQTGDWSAEWKAYFARLRFCIGELNIAPASFVIAPEAAQIVMVGQAPGVAIDKLIAAPSGAVSIAGVAPVLVVDQLISAPAGAAQIAGLAPVALVDQLISAPAGAMQIAGLAPDAQVTVEVDAPSGAMEIAGQVPTVEATTPATITFTDSSLNPGDGTTITFTSQSFGAATVADHIIVLITGRAINPRTISSVTVDGEAAAEVAFIDNAPDTNDNLAAIYIAPATGDATGDIVVTWSNTTVRTGIGVFFATGLESTTPTDTATDSGTTLSVSLDISAGGIALAVMFSTAAGASAWTGLTERYDEEIESGNVQSGASDAFASAQTGLTISNDKSDVDSAFAAASFR